jgi:hypothetical protein
MAEKCKSCGALIIWATTQSGKLMPLNAEPDPKGNLAISRWATVVAVHQRTDLTETQGMPTHTSHFATCPNAAGHRKVKR